MKGNAMTTRHALVDTALDQLTLVAVGDAIAGLYFAHHIRRPAQALFGPAVHIGGDALLAAAAEQLSSCATIWRASGADSTCRLTPQAMRFSTRCGAL